MIRSLRGALARFCARRAAAAQRDAPRLALTWLRLGCRLAPGYADTYPALVHLSRVLEDRWGAVAAAREASTRFPDHADAWMLLGDALQMVFRQEDALGAFEQALVLEERADAAMAAGTLYQRMGRFPEAAARFARAYAAGGGAQALWYNAQALYDAGDHGAADQALDLWATQVPDGHQKLSEARAELRAKAAARPVDQSFLERKNSETA
jgi:tetratricopeptide (TPR) repeat protein